MARRKVGMLGFLRKAKENGATHVIFVCANPDHKAIPMFVFANESVQDRIDHCNRVCKNAVMEVYNLSMDIGMQLEEFLAYHL